MKVFVAGASGAIGRPLIAELVRTGHSVIGLTRAEAGAKALAKMGAEAVMADALNQEAVETALRQSQAEAVIDELTSLPKDPAEYAAWFAGDRKLRLEGGGFLHGAAQKFGVRRYLQQASGFFLKADGGLADESSPLAVDASPGISAGAQMYAQIEARLNGSAAPMEGVLLRYGFFYGPGTWYDPAGASATDARNQQMPLIGEGKGVWSFVHIEDAARATVAALTAPAGTYNVVDDDPSAVSVWLPKFAAAMGAPPPPAISEEVALEQAGPDAVYYQTRLSGAANTKARRVLDFQPRQLEWLAAR